MQLKKPLSKSIRILSNRVSHVILAIALCATASASAAQRTDAFEYRMTTLGIKEGLSQNAVNSLLRDSRGFLWIGTRYGLNRYDFSNIIQFYATESGGSLPSENVHKVIETPYGDIWALCLNGTAIYDDINNTFNEIRYEKEKPLILKSSLNEGRTVLFGGKGELYRYDCTTRKLTRVNTTGGSSSYYTQLLPVDPDNVMLITRWDGAWNYKRSTGEITPYPGIEGKNIAAAYIDILGRAWISFYNEGLTCYDQSGKKLTAINKSNSNLECDIVLDIIPGIAPDELWIATDGAGVRSLRTETGEVSLITPKGSTSVMTLYKDGYGNLYSGTVDEGVQLFNKIAMHTTRSIPGHPSTRLSAHCFLDDQQDPDNMYMATNGEGIWTINRRTGEFTPIESTKGLKVTRVEDYDQENMIFSVFSDDVYLLNRRTHAVSRAPKPFRDAAYEASRRGTGTDLRRLANGTFAAINNDLFIIDPALGTVKRIDIPGKDSRGFMRPFYLDSNVLMLFGSNSLISYNFNTGQAKVMATFPASTKIHAAQYDGAHNIYVGGNSGLQKIDLRRGKSEDVPGYSNDKRHLNVTSLLLDGDHLWAGCSNSLFVTDLTKKCTVEFNILDGVEPNEFLDRATYAGPNAILMGGSKGLLYIDRNAFHDLMSYESAISFALSDVVVDGQSLIAGASGTGIVDIPRHYGTLELSFIDSERNPLRNKRYRFYINDGSKTSTIETDSHSLMLPMLANGTDYEISIATTLIDGAWTEPTKIASLRVAGPAWRSWWAMLIYAFVLSGCAAVYVLHRRSLNKERFQLARQAQVEKERDFMQSINNELRTPLTLIYAPLKLMLSRMEERGENPSEIKELKDIYRNTKRMRDVMDITFQQWRAQSEASVLNIAPQASVADSTDQKETAQKSENTVDMSALTLLISENDEEMCEFLSNQLKPLFHKVAHYTSGADAWDAIRTGKNVPDLIITADLELASNVKGFESTGHIPVIFLSSVLGQQDKQEVYRRSIDSYISKPFDMPVLLSRCGNLLRSHQMMRERYKGQHSVTMAEKMAHDNASEEFLRKVNQIIERELANPDFSVEMLAQEMLMSRSSLYSRFREMTGGQSVGQYVSDYRMARAKELLSSTKMPLSEIAAMLGYSSQRYFSAAFKQRTGVTPSTFRSTAEQQPKG